MDTIYQRVGATFTSHRWLLHDFNEDAKDNHSMIPDTTVPVFALLCPSTISTSKLISAPHLRPPLGKISTFVEYLEIAPIWEKGLLSNTHFLNPEQQAWHNLTHTHCTCVSDRSAPSPKGSFAWVVSTNCGQHLAQCSGPVFGHRILSYWLESNGVLSLLHFLLIMDSAYSTSTGRSLVVLVWTLKNLM